LQLCATVSNWADFAVSAAVAEADLLPLHSRAQCPFHCIVGRLYSLTLQKREQAFEVNEQRRRDIAHVAVGVVQMRLRQCE
jgi:hypothetical protein